MNKCLIISVVLICLAIDFKSQTKADTIVFDSMGAKLMGYFISSPSYKSPTLLFTQGFMETGDIWGIGANLSANGINVFMFDFRGCHKSTGKQGLMNSQEDIASALAFLKSDEMIEKYRIDTTNIILGGYSYGGHMSMLFAINHPQIQRVISVSGGDLGIFGDLIQSNPQIKKGYSEFFNSIKKPDGPVDFKFEDPLLELIANHEYFYILKQANKLSNVDIFLAGGLDDQVVKLEEYILPLYRTLKKNKEQKIKCMVYQTGHSFKKANKELLQDIYNWITNQ